MFDWSSIGPRLGLHWSLCGARLGGFGVEKGGLAARKRGWVYWRHSGHTVDTLWRHCGARLGMKNPPLRTAGEVGSVSKIVSLVTRLEVAYIHRESLQAHINYLNSDSPDPPNRYYRDRLDAVFHGDN